MPKVKNPEARIMEYFETAPLDAARVLHNIAKGVLQRRSQVPSTPPPVGKAKVAKKPPVGGPAGVVVRKPRASKQLPLAETPTQPIDPAAPEVLG